MTFSEIVSDIAERLNLTDARALTRIGKHVNERYRWLASTVNLQTLARTTVAASTTIGSSFVTFTGCEKIRSVYNPAYTPAMVLDERTVDELRNGPLGTDPPSQYAVYTMGATTVTIKLNTVAATVFALGADAEANITTLSGTNVPAFAESYHDLLIFGVLATELEKLEKYEFAKKQEAMFQQRLSELRFFIHKSAYLKQHQGKSSDSGITRYNV